MSDYDIARVHYFEGKFLRRADFTDEQAYQMGMRRRHNIAHHTWGIVRGLELIYDEKAESLFVQKGMAVDGYGRELLLPVQQPIALSTFVTLGSEILDVYLVFNQVESDNAQQGYAACDPGDGSATSLRQSSFYRWHEQPELL